MVFLKKDDFPEGYSIRMRKLSLSVFALCAGVQLSAAGVRIIENTPNKLTFEWTTDSVKIIQNHGAATRLLFSGSNIELGESNEPIIPAFSFYVAVPPQGEAVTSFSASASRTVVLTQQLEVRIASKMLPKTYKRYSNLAFSQPWISKGRVSPLSDLSCRQFILRPFVYDPATKTLQVLDKGVFSISFPSAPFRGIAKTRPQSDFKNMVRRLVMNYDVASGWTNPAPLAKLAKTKQYPFAASDSQATFAIGDGHGGINEGTIDENGVIKIMGSDLIRIFGSQVSLSKIALYASYKGELDSTTPAYGDIPDGMSEEPVLRFDNGKPDSLDPSDYILSYVGSISDWAFDSSKHQYSYGLDLYDDYRHYWLGVKNTGPGLPLSRMTPLTDPVPDTLTSTPGHYLLERSAWKSITELEGGLTWAWTILTSNNPLFSYNNVTLPFADASAPCSIMVTTVFTAGTPSITLVYGGATVGSNCSMGIWYPAKYPGDNQQITLGIQNHQSDSIELKSFEFRYQQKLTMGAQKPMTVFSPEQPGLVRYRLTGLGSDLVYIFRIGNGEQSVMLIDTVRGVASYEWTDTAGIGIRYYVCTQDSLRPAPPLVSVPSRTVSGSGSFMVKDLRTPSQSIDYLVISHPDFMTQAQRLVRHKRNIGRFPNAVAVSIADVYAQFSGGNTDPAAIRNCLAYVRNYQQQKNPTNPSLDYVVLMGAGNWDYRGLTSSSDPSYIPVAEINSRCVEDFFVCLHPGAWAENTDTIAEPDMFLGRLPCRTAAEAGQIVDKIIQTEDPTVANFGGWRNRMLLVADDDKQGQVDDQILSPSHTESSEMVNVMVGGLSPTIDIRKVYLFDYPWDAQLEKPEAAQALINTINNGVAIVNYFGHGAYNVWADEHILMPQNLGNLANNGEYPIINSFSCSVGKFDMPGSTRCLSEDLVVADKSGAIATISATREAYAQNNTDLATHFYANVLDTVDGAARSYGEALAEAKIALYVDDNQKIYCYLGDPSISFLRPDRKISLTAVADNGAVLDTMKALQQVTIKGVVGAVGAQRVNSPDAAYGGNQANILVSMFNPPYLTTRKDGGTFTNPTYFEPGTPLFMGTTHVTGGIFTQRILIPKNVSFDKTGAKLTAFAWLGPDVGVGMKNIVFHGYTQASVSDTSGPVISVRPVYTTTITTSSDASSAKGASSTDKISASCPFTMEIDVFDSSGVDAVSTGPDEGLTYQITGPKNQDRKNINQQFQFVSGDYRRGNAMISFDGNNAWPLGEYKMAISSQDLLGNVSHRTITMEVMDAQDLALNHVFNYPNPMRLGQTCQFYFDLSMSTIQQNIDEVRVMIRLYTLSGRLIRVMENVQRGQVFDGRDFSGHLLSPGVYLYQISAANQNKVVKSKIEKLAINPPR
jgi:Peptidase family C25